MSSGLDLNNVLSVSNLVKAGLAVETGGMSVLIEQALKQAAGQLAAEAFGGALQNLGITGSTGQMLMDAFKGGIDLASGSFANLPLDAQNLANDLANASYQSEAFANLRNDFTQLMLTFLERQSANQDDGTDNSSASGSNKGGSGRNSWLMAIAKSLGNQANALAHQLDISTNHINTKDPKSMMQAQELAQEFGLFMGMSNNLITTIGSAMSQMVRKSG